MKEFYVNARFLTQPMSGVQRFAAEVSMEMRRRNLPVHFVAPVNVIHHQLSDQLECELIGRATGHLWEQTELPRLLKKRGKPLLINLANTGPRKYSNAALTLHDMAFIRHPEWFSKIFSSYYRWLVPQLARKCRHIWTVSEFSAKEIVELCKVHAARVSVVGNGISSVMRKTGAKEMPDLPEKFILGLTGNNPRKNQEALIMAHQQLKDTGLYLVLTGAESSNFNRGRKKNLTEELQRVIFLPNVSDNNLKWLYTHAEVFVYPSYYEGFGLPPLEAMDASCPVVLSDIPVFREIYKGAAHFIHPNQPKELAEAILKIRSDETYRQQLVIAGNKLVEKHTFKKVVNRMLSVLEAD